MTLEKLQQEMNNALREHNQNKRLVLSGLIAQIKKAAIDANCKNNIDEDFVDKEIIKAKKVIQEMIDTCPNDRQDLMEKYTTQKDIIQLYAPTLIADKDEIKNIIESHPEIPRTKPNLMKFFSQNYKNKVDMKIVNIVVGEYI